MAKKLGRLAGLAALAGAAYMMREKFGKDKDAKFQEDRINQTSKLIPKDKKVGSDETKLKTQAESIKDADKSDKSTSNSTRGASGTTTSGPDKSAVDLNKNRNASINPRNVVSEPVKENRRNLKPTDLPKTVVPGGVKKRTEGNSPMPSLKKVEARAATNKTDAMRNASRKAAVAAAAARKSKTPAAPAFTTTKVAGTPPAKSRNMLEEAKEEARRRAAASQTTRTYTSSSTSPVTRTPFPGSSALNKKHGGAVKMASGGMAASRRGDGIAQRGKTRGKMC